MTTLQRVWDEAVKGAERRDWRVGYTGDGGGHVTVPNKPGWYYVRLGVEGSTTVTQAKNHPKLGVPPDPNLPIRVRRDNGILTIYGDEPLSSGSVPAELGDLADVITGGEESHQVLQYRSADSTWVNQYLALYTGPAQTVVIAADAINVTDGSHWRVQAESGASDTLTTIASDQAGHRIVVRPVPGHTILLQTGTGNLALHNGDCSLSSDDHAIELLYISGPPARWIELGRTVGSGEGLIYVAGQGIAISGSTIAVDLASNSGLTFVGNELVVADSLAGNGLEMNATKGIDLKLSIPSGLEIVSDALRLRDDVAGQGLLMTGKVMSIDLESVSGLLMGAGATGKLKVDVGRGLDFAPAGNALEVNEGFDFSWTGTHSFAGTATFHVDPQIDANLNFIGGPRSITSSPSNHLTLNPGGDLILPSNKTFRSSDYADGIPITGFSLFPDPSGDRQLTIFGIKVDEMHARAFVADMVRVDIGEEWWGKSLGLLYDDFTTPSVIGGTATMVLEDAPSIAGELFTAGDWVMLRVIDLPAAGTTGTATIAYVWGQVTSYVDLVADDNGIGRQQWTFTLRDGPFSTLIKKGSVVVCFGVSGQGYIHLSALDSAQGPWIQIGDWNGANPYAAGNRTPRTQIGRLDGLSDPEMTPAGWGLYSDNAYLRGMLRTAETMMNDDGLLLEQMNFTTPTTPGNASIAWVEDVNAATLDPILELRSWTYTDTDRDEAYLRLSQRPISSLATLTLEASGTDSAYIRLESTGRLFLFGGGSGIEAGAHLYPQVDLALDLGTASLRWRNLYVDQLFVSGSISGDTLSGAEWEYPGSMIIDANSAGATTVTITNQGTGLASLDVEGNITLGGTVDGVDIFAHNANPSAHHALATAGDGVTVTGQQIAVNTTVVRTTRTVTAGDGLDGGGDLSANRSFAVDSSVVRTSRTITTGNGLSGGGALSANLILQIIAGDGMNVTVDGVEVDGSVVRTSRLITAGDGLTGGGSLAADRTLAVNPGEGIELLADAVAIALHTNSGLEFSGARLRLGLPTTLDVATTNLVTGNTHAHNIDSTADASGLSAPMLLHATSAGGLILGTLTVAGNVDITDGGDLDVANHTLFVDASANSVGIGGLPVGGGTFPDPQFALDVNGPLRAQYLIGPHALQVKDVILLSHFDGKEPFNTNSSGEPNSTMGQVGTPGPLTTSPLVFRPGKFFKALEIAQAATNLIANPQFDGGSATGWIDYATGAAAGTRSVLATRETYIGEYSYRVYKTGGADADRWGTRASYAVTSGQSYTLSVWLYTAGMTGGLKRIRLFTDTNVPSSSAFHITPDIGTTGQWERVNLTVTATATGTAFLYVWLDDVTTGLFYLSAVQVTETAYAQPYTQTSRAANGLVYRGVSANWAKLTLMAWIHPAAAGSAAGIVRRILTLYKDATNFYALNYHTTDTVRLADTSGNLVISSVTIPGNAWSHVALTVGGGTATLYINGVAAGSGAIAAHPAGTLPDLYVGCTNAFASHINGLLDDVVLVDRTLPAEEILSIVQSNAPVFAETVRYSARFTQKGLGWFDDEGLWMKDTLGKAVMGFYGGEAVGKLWAGTTLDAGDIFFGVYGTEGGGWLRFDRDGSAGATKGLLTLGYAGEDVFTLSGTAAKLQGINLEIFNGANEFLGVFATAPAGGTWAGATGVAAGDVIIGDYGRGAALWWDDNLANLFIGAPAATGNHLAIGPNNLNLVRAGVTRMRLDSNGWLTIRNSDGAAVFTFNSSLGAEFTLPLTLGTAGGIYQGTGIFGGTVEPGGTIGTGLKIFNTGGIGKLSTYNTGVEQVTLDTDGRFKAGGGIVRLDAGGISVLSPIASSDSAIYAYTFRDDNNVEFGGLYSHLFPSISGSRTVSLSLLSETRSAFLGVRAESMTGSELTISSTVSSNYANLELAVNPTPLASLRSTGVINLASGSEIRMVNDSTITAAIAGGGAVQMTQTSTSAAVPVLALAQDDLSEEFFAFVGSVAAGNPIEAKGAKNLTTTHFVRVSLNGTFYYMAVGTIA